MPGGPVFSFSAKPDTPDLAFPNFGGSGSDTEGLGVAASIGADTTWKLRFYALPDLTGIGTGKVRLDMLVNAIVGDARLNVQWASVADGEDIDAAVLNAEGVQTITAPAVANQTVRTEIILDADTLVANEIIVMDLVFETAGFTLAQVSTWLVSILWE